MVFSLHKKTQMKYSESLKKNDDFQTVYKEGTHKADSLFVLHVKKNELGKNRLGISVTKKVGNSVVRHKIRRRIKEAYRQNEESFKCGYDLVFSARADAKDSTYLKIESAIRRLMKRQGLFKEEENEVSPD